MILRVGFPILILLDVIECWRFVGVGIVSESSKGLIQPEFPSSLALWIMIGDGRVGPSVKELAVPCFSSWIFFLEDFASLASISNREEGSEIPAVLGELHAPIPMEALVEASSLDLVGVLRCIPFGAMPI